MYKAFFGLTLIEKGKQKTKSMRLYLFILGILFLGACVPNKKLVYLQDGDLKKREDIPKDSILRTHKLKFREYRIQPLDILSVNFETLSKENDDFDFLSKLSPRIGVGGSNLSAAAALTGIVVNIDGIIEYAVLGKIRVTGLTIFEAEDAIREIASRYVPDVIVRVRMLNFRYTVLGEVNAERTIVSSTTRLTMMEAIGQAGGLGELADRSHVKIIRQNGDKTEVFYVNLLNEEYLESPYYFVQQNDVIIVPPLKQRPFKRYFTSNLGIVTSTLSFVLLILTLSTR